MSTKRSLVEVDVVPDRAGDRRFTIVVWPDVTASNEVRDVTFFDAAGVGTDAALVERRDAGASQRPGGEQVVCRVKEQWKVVAIAHVQNRFRSAQRQPILFSRIKPVVVHGRSGQNGPNSLLIIAAADKGPILNSTATEQVQRCRDHTGSMTVPDQADRIRIRNARDEIGEVESVQFGPPTKASGVGGVDGVRQQLRGVVAGPRKEDHLNRTMGCGVAQPAIRPSAVSQHRFPENETAMDHEADRNARLKRGIQLIKAGAAARSRTVETIHAETAVLIAFQLRVTTARADDPIVGVARAANRTGVARLQSRDSRRLSDGLQRTGRLRQTGIRIGNSQTYPQHHKRTAAPRILAGS